MSYKYKITVKYIFIYLIFIKNKETIFVMETKLKNIFNILFLKKNNCLFYLFFCRINRILESPRGSAMLVGVGGSGKQSLARLAAYISSLEVAQIQLRKGFGVSDLRVGSLAVS